MTRLYKLYYLQPLTNTVLPNHRNEEELLIEVKKILNCIITNTPAVAFSVYGLFTAILSVPAFYLLIS